ncbi:hypothetical protein R2F25_22850 [Streptomyces sp. UP1A-1]|nr:hypothetical protein [Streptomyces sp. UP1A-1]
MTTAPGTDATAPGTSGDARQPGTSADPDPSRSPAEHPARRRRRRDRPGALAVQPGTASRLPRPIGPDR